MKTLTLLDKPFHIVDENLNATDRTVPDTEGGVHEIPCQAETYKLLAAGRKNILEIGFNTGASAAIFLEASPKSRVTSFDIGTHEYVDPHKMRIDAQYPGRHELILGDSASMIPQYKRDNPDAIFDLILIDGDHTYPAPAIDLANCFLLADENTVVILDDVICAPAGAEEFQFYTYLVGPSMAWREAATEGFITGATFPNYSVDHLLNHGGGECYTRTNGKSGLHRGMAWFSYNMRYE